MTPDTVKTTPRRQRAAKPERRTRGPSSQPLDVADMSGAMLTRRTVCALLGVSEDTIRRMVVRGEFPAPQALTRALHRWPAEQVRQWVAQRAAANP